MSSPALPPPAPHPRPEPRWPAMVAILAVGGLYAALPESLAAGPRWFMPVIVLLLLIPTIVTHYRQKHFLNQVLGHILGGVLTAFMLGSLALLVLALPERKESPVLLLRSAASLWVTNVLVFALWYWRLDAGGPHKRHRTECHTRGAFLFPQMTIQDKPGHEHHAHWRPHFIDYLFIAFNTSTAFSPTDAPVLSRWAKCLFMIQSSISLAVVVILAARAVNIL